jgi:hypothetical protein
MTWMPDAFMGGANTISPRQLLNGFGPCERLLTAIFDRLGLLPLFPAVAERKKNKSTLTGGR